MNDNIKTVILGNEYDDELIDRLRMLLQSENVSLVDKLSGIAGSQEFKSYDFEVRGQRILVEIETYIGVSLIGPSDIVDEFVAKLKGIVIG